MIHPSYVEPDQLTGEYVWVKQAVAARNVRLPIAKVSIAGPFSELITQAAVSPQLLPEYRYLFSNRSDQLLREKGYNFEKLPRREPAGLAAKSSSSDRVATSKRNSETQTDREHGAFPEAHDRRQRKYTVCKAPVSGDVSTTPCLGCLGSSGSREALQTATVPNARTSQSNDVPRQSPNQVGCESRQHESFETRRVSPDASSEPSSAGEKPAVETLNDVHGAAEPSDGGATERVASVPPFSETQILDVRQRPAELVAIPVSSGVEPPSETTPPVPKLALTAGKESENTPRCSLDDSVTNKGGQSSHARMPSGNAACSLCAGSQRTSERPRTKAHASLERWKLEQCPPRARDTSRKKADVLSTGRSCFQRAGAPKVRLRKGKDQGNDESSNRGSRREKWPVEA